jgi:hypothetical protein
VEKFSKNTQTWNLMKIRPVGADLFHADGYWNRLADTRDEDNIRFLRFCELVLKKKPLYGDHILRSWQSVCLRPNNVDLIVCRIFVNFFTASRLTCLVSWTPFQWQSYVTWEWKRISTFIFHISERIIVKSDVEDLNKMPLSNFEFCNHWRCESYILWSVNEILPIFSTFFIHKIQHSYFDKVIQWLLFFV